jgi:hypothetical protein
MRVNALDALAVQIHHQAQHAVRRWVLGAEVNGKLAVFLSVLFDGRRHN